MDRDIKNNSIDELYSKEFSDYTEDPPEIVWDRIADKLSHKKKVRKFTIFLGSAATIALILSMGIGYYMGSHSYSAIIAKIEPTNHDKANETKKNETVINESPYIKNKSDISAARNSYNSAIENDTTIRTSVTEKMPSKITNANSNIVTENKSIGNPDTFTNLESKAGELNDTSIYYKLSDVKQLASIEDIDIKKKNPLFDHFYLSLTGAPLYSYRNIDNYANSTQLNRFEKPSITFSAGFNIIAEKKRFRIQSGLYFTKMGISIQDIKVNTTSYKSSVDNSSANFIDENNRLLNSIGVIETNDRDKVYSNNYMLSIETNLSKDRNIASYYWENENKVTFTQSFNYIEIPFIFQYNVYQQYIEIGLQGGIDLNFLINNTVKADLNKSTVIIGKTQDINNFNIGGSLGVSVIVPLTTSWSYIFEPRFRYYFSSINKSSLIENHLYSFGLYMGVQRSF
jgi:hypothetical protein